MTIGGIARWPNLPGTTGNDESKGMPTDRQRNMAAWHYTWALAHGLVEAPSQIVPFDRCEPEHTAGYGTPERVLLDQLEAVGSKTAFYLFRGEYLSFEQATKATLLEKTR